MPSTGRWSSSSASLSSPSSTSGAVRLDEPLTEPSTEPSTASSSLPDPSPSPTSVTETTTSTSVLALDQGQMDMILGASLVVIFLLAAILFAQFRRP